MSTTSYSNLAHTFFLILIIFVIAFAALLIITMIFSTKNMRRHEGAIWSDIKRIGPIPVPWHLYELTNERMFEKSGLFKRVEKETYLYLITDVRLEEGLIQRFCKTGTVVIASRDEDTAAQKIIGIKLPGQTKETISKAVLIERKNRQEIILR